MKNLNRIIPLLTLFLTVLSISAQGPGPKPGRERIKTLKVAFLTERLSLSSKEAQVFWPIYNRHESKLEELRKKERSLIKNSNWDFTNDANNKELSEYLKTQLKYKDEKHKLEVNLITEVMEELSPRKAILLIKAEESFKKRLLQQFRNRRGQR
ncbi:hypothetical protein [uncultured Croceitalea sp.]|uniref:hypothetical protein n=1 Tax=uncultured Croceitalea sp. TaxID=1798908 RepID=UPI0033062104